jgi:hypothetical protein
MNWAAAAVKYAQAHYRNLQRFHISYSRKAKGNLDASFFLSSEEQKDLKWWISGADYISGRPIIFLSPEISIYSDASLTGWEQFVLIQERVVHGQRKKGRSI